MDRKEYYKKWFNENRDRNLEANRNAKAKWRAKNKQKIMEYNSTYDKTEKGIKSRLKKVWKYHGIISNDWEATYNHYINCTYCEWCDEPFKNSRDKHLDHDHDINNEVNIRGVLCCSCNTRDYLGKFMQTLQN